MLKAKNKKSIIHIYYLTNFRFEGNSPSIMDASTIIVTKFDLVNDIDVNLKK